MNDADESHFNFPSTSWVFEVEETIDVNFFYFSHPLDTHYWNKQYKKAIKTLVIKKKTTNALSKGISHFRITSVNSFSKKTINQSISVLHAISR